MRALCAELARTPASKSTCHDALIQRTASWAIIFPNKKIPIQLIIYTETINPASEHLHN